MKIKGPFTKVAFIKVTLLSSVLIFVDTLTLFYNNHKPKKVTISCPSNFENPLPLPTKYMCTMGFIMITQ
jgi:hypothetical protein